MSKYQKEYHKKWHLAHREEEKERSRKWKEVHPGYQQANHHQRAYDEPIENKQIRLEAQGYKCANQECLKPIDLTTGHQDHNHKTGEKRGVLCGSCNRALGLLKDDAKQAAGLSAYRLRFEA